MSVGLHNPREAAVADTAGIERLRPLTGSPQTAESLTVGDARFATSWTATPFEKQSLSLRGLMSRSFYQDIPIPGTPSHVDEVRAAVPNLGLWRNQRSPAEIVDGMKKWDGVVKNIEDNSFTVELEPANHEGVAVYADFDTALISETELDSLMPGSVVYVTVRTVRNQSGQPSRTSAIRVARLGRWSHADVENARKRARARTARLLANIE